jgi:hypothetical protein
MGWSGSARFARHLSNVTAPFRRISLLVSLILATLLPARAQIPSLNVDSDVGMSPNSSILAVRSMNWASWGSFQSGFGYRDNVLMSHAGEDRSGLIRSGFDAWVCHDPLGRADLLSGITATGTRYLSADLAKKAIETIVLAEWRYRLDDSLKLTFASNGYYFDQIFDAASEDDPRPVGSEVETLGGSLGSKLRWTVRSVWWFEVQASGKREIFPDGFYNRGLLDSGGRVGWHPNKRVEVSIAGIARRRGYDRRPQNSISGRPLSGTRLTVAERESEARVDATLDQAGRWKVVVRAGVLRYSDNGAGYLNYRHRRVAQELEWQSDNWTVAIEGSARRVEYEKQTVGLGIAPPRRVRDEFSGRLRIERKLGERWAAYTECNWERNRSNDELASYTVNEGLLGIRWNWEK